MPSINRHNVKWPEALLHLLLFEISSDMQEPLLLPFSEHNKSPEESSLFQVEKFLATMFGYLDISFLLSLSFDIGF